MRKLDKFEQLANDSQVAFVILGNGQEFELVPLAGGSLSEMRVRELQQRGFEFCGVIGLIGGSPRSALCCPLDPPVISALCQAFLVRIEDVATRVESQMMGDSLDFLTRLYRLPDTRN